GLTMTNDRFHQLFGGPPRSPESTLDQRHMDLAASIQEVTEEAVLRIGREVHRRTGADRLVMAGGVALNCVANGRLLREGPFEDIWIQPAAGDAGGALGAALMAYYERSSAVRTVNPDDDMEGSYLGPAFSPEQIEDVLAREGLPAERLSDAE